MPNFAPLAHSFVQTVQAALANDDEKTLRRLNVTRQNAEDLVRLSASEVSQMARHHFLNVTLNTAALPRYIQHVRTKTAQDLLIDDLIRAGANHPFIARFFAFTPHDMAARRKVLGIPCLGGRESLPNDALMQKIHQYWCQLRIDKANLTSLARAVIQTAQALSAPFGHVVYVIDDDLPAIKHQTRSPS